MLAVAAVAAASTGGGLRGGGMHAGRIHGGAGRFHGGRGRYVGRVHPWSPSCWRCAARVIVDRWQDRGAAMQEVDAAISD